MLNASFKVSYPFRMTSLNANNVRHTFTLLLDGINWDLLITSAVVISVSSTYIAPFEDQQYRRNRISIPEFYQLGSSHLPVVAGSQTEVFPVGLGQLIKKHYDYLALTRKKLKYGIIVCRPGGALFHFATLFLYITTNRTRNTAKIAGNIFVIFCYKSL